MNYKLYTDGSHSSQLNIAGIGGFLLDSNNNQIFSFSEPINSLMSSHELHAIEHGLKKALEAGVRHISCYTDFITNAKALNIKELKEETSENNILLNKIIKLSREFDSINFQYIPRDDNKIADKLARKLLEDAMKESSRVNIAQSKNPTDNFFKCNKLFTTEQFTSKEKYFDIKRTISTYYVFEKKSTADADFLDIYQVNKQKNITYEKIKTHVFKDNLWKEFLAQIKDTLDNSKDLNVALLMAKNTDVEQMLRGMRPVTKKLAPSFEELNLSMQRMNMICLESGGLAYEAIFPPVVKKKENEKQAFYFQAMKTLGENYTIGQNKEIENYFDLPTTKKERIDEIKKKYFGEFMKMIIAQNLSIDFKQAKKDLTEQGIKFKY